MLMTQTTAPAPARTEVTGAQVQTAVRTFAQALAESPAFQAFEQAADRFRQDEAAQAAFQAYRAKQQSLQTMLMLNAVGSEEQAELKRLYQAFISEPSTAAYLEAQEELMSMCQAAANLLSERLGLDFAAACGPGCC
jgi:cell fate (sporulation/competence/biofilm development) regulator YlbF (YheA/YmcA/DUF963 family)